MEFYVRVGPMALGSRLRRLSDRLYASAKRTYALYDIDLDPKWFPVFHVLSHRWEASTQDIADYVGHSHASISQIVKAMVAAGLVSAKKNRFDGRKNVLKLTTKGHTIAANIEPQYEDVGVAVGELLSDTPHDLWRAIDDIECALDAQDLFSRVENKHRKRQLSKVELVDYHPKYDKAFKDINIQWIKQHFKVESADLDYLNHPREKIIEPGGHIYFALLAGNVVGTCAIVKMNPSCFELAKMGVIEKAKGRRIGWLLGAACIERAQALGAKTVYLESNTVLSPALSLYKKLGFVEVAARPSPYTRANIYMELCL